MSDGGPISKLPSVPQSIGKSHDGARPSGHFTVTGLTGADLPTRLERAELEAP